MKRAAEKQLIKDGADEEDEDESGGQIGMKKADDAVLASRKLKPLPKRSGPASATSSPSADSQPRFAGFAGFGTNTSSAFQFTPPTSPSPFSSPFGSPSAPKPSVSDTASNAAKSLSSLIYSTAAPQAAKPSPLTPQPTLPDISSEDSAVEYYKSLRGLNTSILSAITKAMERDPFMDVSFLLDRYKTLRVNVQKDYDQKSNESSSSIVSTPSLSGGSFTMPTPPSSFSGLGANLAASSSAPSSGGGFIPKMDTSKPSTSSSPFSFPPTTNSSSSSNPFSFPSASSKPSDSTSKPSESSTNPFGSSAPAASAPSSSAFSFAAPPSTASASTANLFGAPSATNLFGSSSSSATAAPSTNSPFKFGNGFGGGFSKPSPSAGSIGNPVGFGFGSPTKSDTSAFSFGNPTAVKKEEEEGSKDGGTDGGSDGTQTQPVEGGNEGLALLGPNPHDEEGEGEEDEETLHSIRSKAFKMKKEGDGWADLGTGLLRVKKHKETGQRRLLLRNSSTGKIIINFNIYNGLKPTQNKKTLMFVGHEAGASQTYNVRTKTEEQAAELKSVLDREIAFVRAKQED